MSQEIVFAQVLQQLMDEKYRRNRAELAAVAHISPSALSQYVRGRATPSLDVLVSLAEALDVSLEYLVFGKERASTPLELGYLTAHLETHIRSSQANAGALRDLVVRIGERLGGIIELTARDLLSESEVIVGTLLPEDIALLERYSKKVTIVTTDLSTEILVLKGANADDVTAPSVFARLVAENLKEGTTYEYIVPQGNEWLDAAALLRSEIARLGRMDLKKVSGNLEIIHVSEPCVPGYVLQHFLVQKFKNRYPGLYDRISPFVHADLENSEMGFISYIALTDIKNEKFVMIPSEDIPRIIESLSKIDRRSFHSQRN